MFTASTDREFQMRFRSGSEINDDLAKLSDEQKTLIWEMTYDISQEIAVVLCQRPDELHSIITYIANTYNYGER
jgi:hypothetical protein